MTDYFSKYVEAVPIPDKSAISVAHGVYKVYCRHGAPVGVICDQGREFVNQVRIGSIVWLRGNHSIPHVPKCICVENFN